MNGDPEKEPAAPEPVSYRVSDLDGCAVFTEAGDPLGTLKDVFATKANDVFVVVNDKGREYLIPALKSVVLKIDLEARRIEVRLPTGFREIYET